LAIVFSLNFAFNNYFLPGDGFSYLIIRNGFNEHMHEGFDYDDAHLESRNLVQDTPLIGLILMPSGPFAFKGIAMLSDLDEEVEIAWEV